jgi:WD40 repeat protein
VGNALGPGGATLALALSDHSIRLWDTRLAQKIRCIPTEGPIGYLRFSREGRYLAGTVEEGESSRAGGQGLWVWSMDRSATRPIASLPNVTLAGLNPLRFTRDEQQLVIGFREGQAEVVGLWDFAGSGVLYPLEPSESSVAAVGCSPDGSTVVAVGLGERGSTVTFWDTKTRKRLPAQGRADDYFLSVAFSPDGRRVFAGGLSDEVSVWDVGTGRELMRLDCPQTPFLLSFLGDGKTLLVAALPGMQIWHAPSCEEIEAMEQTRPLVSASVWRQR